MRGLAYLRPSLVTDLIKPLIDLTLSLEKLKLPEFVEKVDSFVKECSTRQIGNHDEFYANPRATLY